MINYKRLRSLSEKRVKELEEIILEKELNLRNAPEGTLRTCRCKKTTQYFIRKEENDKTGQYIKKKDIALAERLAQKEYDERVLKAAREELKCLKRLADVYETHPLEEAQNKMVAAKVDLVNLVAKSDEQYVSEWLSQKFERPDYYSESAKIDNGKGIMMRSKSEVLISTLLDKYGIPNLYEKPMRLGDGLVLPDFTLLDMRSRTEIIWEHLGMMDNEAYVAAALEKIRKYEQHGFILGKGLIVTYETKKTPLNAQHLRNIIKTLFED